MLLNIVIILFGIAIVCIICYYGFQSMYLHSAEKVITMPVVMNMTQTSFPSLLETLEEIYLNKHEKLVLDFRFVRVITHPAFIVVLAQLEKKEIKENYSSTLRIDPRNTELLNMVNGAGSENCHQQYWDTRKLRPSPSIKLRLTNTEITLALEKDLQKIKIFNYYELNTLITELKENALEHGIKQKNINWRLHHHYDSQRNLIQIAFVDMGCGIITSYKESGLVPKSNPDDETIMAALDGSLGSTTKEDNRGRGLPQIYTMVKNKLISDFVMITNHVSVRYIDNKLETQKHANFVGTFYSFSVNSSNFNNYNIWKKGLISQETSVKS